VLALLVATHAPHGLFDAFAAPETPPAAPADALAFTEADGRVTVGGTGSLGAFEVVATAFSGTIAPADGTGELVVPALALRTGLGPRDSRMATWCLEAERFPTITFTLTGGALPADGVLKGRLTIRDVTREIEIPASVAWEGPNLHLKGRTEMDLRNWSVPDPAIVLATMDPVVTVTFDVVARPS
jgi:polyisoprenoid-binding protein YceI